MQGAGSGVDEERRGPRLQPEDHRSRRLHGHSFFAAVRAELPAGWAPFAGGEVAELQRRMEACCAPLDYALLNEVEGLGAIEAVCEGV